MEIHSFFSIGQEYQAVFLPFPQCSCIAITVLALIMLQMTEQLSLLEREEPCWLTSLLVHEGFAWNGCPWAGLPGSAAACGGRGCSAAAWAGSAPLCLCAPGSLRLPPLWACQPAAAAGATPSPLPPLPVPSGVRSVQRGGPRELGVCTSLLISDVPELTTFIT
ncbi:hypothetical protein KIL84_012462, partial [Mauremys mutica]